MKSYCSATFILVALAIGQGLSFAQETRKEDLWTHERDKQYGHIMATAELTLHPMPEARPALRYRLVRDRYEMRSGDSAPFYLKAIGFFEQTNAQAAVREFIQTNAKKAREEGKEDYPPYTWLETPPKELPKEEVKKFLQWVTFQSQFLEEASYRSTFHLGRDMKQIENPIAYLLPEIQQLRELARMQSLRTRMAIAEDQVDDALIILRQQYSLAKHLGDDEFIVSNLVGAAIAGIAFGDSLHLLQHAKTPNLYWAFASLPDPLIDMSNANSYERNLLVEQVKLLREVSEDVRPAGFWSDFIDRLVPSIMSMQSELSIAANGPEQLRAGLVGMIAASYPNAKRFLIEDCGMPKAKVESYPTTQAVLLALRKFHDQRADEDLKWIHVPLHQATKYRAKQTDRLKLDEDRAGWLIVSSNLLFFSVDPARQAQQRIQQTTALLQTVEALRMHLALNGNKLPASLDDLPVPAPVDPFTGKPFVYENQGGLATITGARMTGLQYRLVLKVAK